ncbi:MAG: C40 family peptidase [Nocardioides sp.]
MSSTMQARFGAPTHRRAAARLVVLPSLLIGALGGQVAAPAATAHASTPHASTGAARDSKAHHRKHHHKRKHHHQQRRRRLGHSVGREERAMRIAVRQKGKPYVYGASGPRAFDCSGLTSFAFHRAGFKGMPRTAAAQAGFARHISRARMHRGDLIFFTEGSGVYHVGLYAGWYHGHRMVLHAPHPGERVKVQRLWTSGWFPGTLRFR